MFAALEKSASGRIFDVEILVPACHSFAELVAMLVVVAMMRTIVSVYRS
jgi:hypothetical protein